MPKYRVNMTQEVVEKATIWIEAESEAAAAEKAIAMANNGEIEWSFLMTTDDPPSICETLLDKSRWTGPDSETPHPDVNPFYPESPEGREWQRNHDDEER